MKACIFDLDGVIVDTAKYHFVAWKEIASLLSIEFTEKDNEALKGVSRMKSLEIILSLGKIKATEETKIKLAKEKNDIYLSYVNKITPEELLPGAIKLLTELKEHQIKIALGSASKNAPAILNRLQITHLFDSVIDGNEVEKAKPDPEVFLKGAYELQVNPKDCIVFEDAVSGIEAAIAGKMFPIGIGDAQTLKEAKIVVPDLSHINYSKLSKLNLHA